jgi:hypothetical protein
MAAAVEPRTPEMPEDRAPEMGVTGTSDIATVGASPASEKWMLAPQELQKRLLAGSSVEQEAQRGIFNTVQQAPRSSIGLC